MDTACGGSTTGKFELAAEAATLEEEYMPVLFYPSLLSAAGFLTGTRTLSRFSNANRTSFLWREFEPLCFAKRHAKSITSSITSSAKLDS